MSEPIRYPIRRRTVVNSSTDATPDVTRNASSHSLAHFAASSTSAARLNSALSAPPSLMRPTQRRGVPVRRPASDTAVVTMLTPLERPSVDAAGEGCYITLHRESMEEVLTELRACRAQAVLVSVAKCNARAASSVARLVREFPAVPAMALLSANDADAAHAVLALGQYGVRSLVDVRDPMGWRTLRQLVSAQRGDSIERRAMQCMATLLPTAPEDCRRFLDACFQSPPRVGTVRQLSKRLGVQASTLMSRFYRANLPAPKRYLAFARLVRAAALFENPGLSITQVANHLEYSSPQSFGRHIHTMLGLTAARFRQQFDGARMLERFTDELVQPYHAILSAFRPLVVLPPWSRAVELPLGELSHGVPPHGVSPHNVSPHGVPPRDRVPHDAATTRATSNETSPLTPAANSATPRALVSEAQPTEPGPP